MLIDFAGPEPLAIDGEVLDELAAGHRLVETAPDVFGWAISSPVEVQNDGADSAPE